jgi:hypothetical protein
MTHMSKAHRAALSALIHCKDFTFLDATLKNIARHVAFLFGHFAFAA